MLFNHDLSPAQERNLEKRCDCRVIDRTSLILDIFAQRARSHEGKLQVELAQLEHLATRLVRGWTHLERQKGGIGLRGPGETQLETDRQLLRKRVKVLKDKLATVHRQRQTQRRARLRPGPDKDRFKILQGFQCVTSRACGTLGWYSAPLEVSEIIEEIVDEISLFGLIAQPTIHATCGL